jgi:hypothetical protein
MAPDLASMPFKQAGITLAEHIRHLFLMDDAQKQTQDRRLI